MPVFRVRGTTRSGEPCAVRFEAPAESSVQAWLLAEGAQVASCSRLPLTSWPFSRLPWMILVFPLLCYGLYVSAMLAIWTGLDLHREATNRDAYKRLQQEGVAVPGTVTTERRVSLRGARRRSLEYAFVTPDGSRHQGRLVAVPGDVSRARHDLRLLPATVKPGDRLTVTVLPSDPGLNAPFPVDDALLERFAALGQQLRRQLFVITALAPALGWLVWNTVVRTGSHYVISPRRPRLVLITRGDDPFAGPEDDEGVEEDDEETG